MNLSVTVTQKQLGELLLDIAVVRPVFIWGPPGIGKSTLVQQFADQVGLPCVSLLGSQLAPEDIIGVPQIVDGCLPAQDDCAKRALLPFSGRAQRLHPGSAESLLQPHP